ncbi:MAG: DUF4388 domain-containing protein [Thermoanaerobaculaceae bacterium]|nr:DUF4388 domain-containing protein [Thermoanaerobaculaceae bacterium]MDI9622168.1 DUF4388 domain-containing protein [Acidobacteriota bacterium]NLH10067.1 DUF4388 domain-containing protein [Holophagae bacterium]HPW54891.1 DUF4388 domain-containing protein [Thermoanaerobaculaceae bacterium]
MALEGTLKDFSLADIFQLIGLQRKTGVLTLRSSEDVVTISFLEGRVVGADSLNKRLEDRLGQVLLKTGGVSQTELEAALRTQMETLERLGHILLRHSIISREELRKALEKQILQIIFRVFRWQNGDYHFSQETSVDYDAELVAPMGAESILMEGARMLDEWPIIEKRIPHRGIVFVSTPAAKKVEVAPDEEMLEEADLDLVATEMAPPTGSDRLRISATEADVLALVDGLNTVDDIVRRSPHGDFETCKALYALLTRALVRPATRDEISRAALAQSTALAVSASETPRMPWLLVALLPLLVLSFVVARRNPLNPVFGPSDKLMPRFATTVSWARMFGLWQIVQGRAALVGAYPDTLAELVHERYVGQERLSDPWGRPYRYVTREQTVQLSGSAFDGTPDPDLILGVRLEPPPEDSEPGQAVTLVTP